MQTFRSEFDKICNIIQCHFKFLLQLLDEKVAFPCSHMSWEGLYLF
eukprot:UN24297